eukprot:5216729-Prymnesium_polylepis.1
MADAEQFWRAAGVLAHPDWYDLPWWFEHRWELIGGVAAVGCDAGAHPTLQSIFRDMWDAFVLLDNM